jgi:N-acetylglucosaminyldiphosphoundecaprenol N-acetyl-beta-D-mannosaminyltransferase
MFQENAALRDAYRDASLVLADGAPVIWASRLLRRALPGRVAGSDLTPAIFAAAKKSRPLRTFLLGAAPGVAKRAAERIEARWPGVQVVGTYSPPLGFEKNDAENAAIVERLNAVSPDLLVIGLGAPKQELWIQRFAPQLKTSVALCVGATIDFLAGEKSRAPKLLQHIGLEWLHRVASEPRRLFRRYARDAWIFPQLVWREWRAG